MGLPQRWIGVLVVSAIIMCASLAAAGMGREQTAEFRRPADLIATSDPAKDPIWALGRTLFFDPRLSASRSLSCAGCHEPSESWTDHRSLAQGEGSHPLAFRVPTLLNAAQFDRYGWTGRFADVEDVTFFAMNSPLNMNLGLDALLDRLAADPAYVIGFAAFPDHAISKANIGAALSRFVRSIVSAPAPFDRWVAGSASAMSPAAVRGFTIFRGKGSCAECHTGWAMTDGSFHDIGTARGEDLGRGQQFKTSMKLQYAFKTPTLRNVAVRAPYMHDGRFATLREVIDNYDKGGIDRPSRDDAIHPLHLTEDEKADLIAFLGELTSTSDFVVLPQRK